MVESACPVDGDVGVASDEPAGGRETAPGRDGAELEQSLEGRAVFSDEEAGPVCGHVVKGVGGDALEAVDVLVRVEAGHLVRGAAVGAEDVEVLVEVVIRYEVVRHPDPVRLHRVDEVERIGPAVLVVKVRHRPLVRPAWRRRQQWPRLHLAVPA